ncbi:MAG: hypothetical protein WC563_15265 [Brevundimonas sp.]
MSNNNSSSQSGGIGLAGLTFIVFLVLKLCHVIDWSWWWVTAPLWGGLAIVLAILGGMFAIAGIVIALAWLWDLCTPKASWWKD